MGYDMYMVQPATDDEKAAEAAAQAAFGVAVAARDAHKETLTQAEELAWRGSMHARLSGHADPATKDSPNVIEMGRLQKAVEEAHEAIYKVRHVYFRLNIWGMGRCCDLMDERGMLVDLGEPPPDNYPYELTEEEQSLVEEHDLQDRALVDPAILSEHPERVSAWVLAWIQGICWAGEPNPPVGIAYHKLCSNDGWVVTPAEIRAALAKLDAFLAAGGEAEPKTDKGEVITWWPEWIDYLKRAADRGGFRVH